MAKTINTELKRMVEEGLKLKTSVNIDYKLTDNTTVIQLTKEQATELAHQLLTFSRVIEKDRIALTIMDNRPNSMSVTSY
ncbi:hypothetical protein LCM20_08555 [Halobacillus litoralis]|uniref:hypothetical protein n=1 Tax=Halobacillus litoralis TaxID=45668 RepID=UPI001CD6D514|nr:hypothetical protein [Halobacillus litoralis]MCA0970635.1 hypothetical protein [Halobacillus litoralis]